MKKIETKNAPGAIGPYSQAMVAGNLVYTSGQLPVDPDSGAVDVTIEGQAEQACKNVQALLKAAGSGIEKVVKTTCFLSDMANFGAFNAIYAQYFTSCPARSCVAVKTLPKNVLVEIEAVAELN